MPTDHRAKLATIKRFDQLIAYLRDEMGWPIARDSFEDVDDLFYDFSADELRRAYRHLAQGGKSHVHFGRPMLSVLPHRPHHPRQGGQEAAIDGSQVGQRGLLG